MRSVKQKGWTVISYWKEMWVWVECVWRTFRKKRCRCWSDTDRTSNLQRRPAECINSNDLCPAGWPATCTADWTDSPSLLYNWRFRHPASHRQSQYVLAPLSSCIHITTFLPNFPWDWFTGKVQFFSQKKIMRLHEAPFSGIIFFFAIVTGVGNLSMTEDYDVQPSLLLIKIIIFWFHVESWILTPWHGEVWFAVISCRRIKNKHKSIQEERNYAAVYYFWLLS